VRLFNTLTRTLEDFQPLEPGVVRMYTCGPTVWNYQHLGNYRTYLLFDLLRRHLEVSGYRVEQVMNITDVDDRIIKRSAEEGVSIGEYTAPWERIFREGLAALRAEPAEHYPHATEYIRGMIDMVEDLIEKGHAYRSDDGIYYRISSFPAYGSLAHLDRAGMRPTARVANDDYDKESAADFALWKFAQPVDEQVGAAWDAPFGRGRPGWHLECSTMSMHFLGQTLDIHGGGIDLLFPHHENEIAQSEGVTGHPFSRFWVHGQFLTDQVGEKMAKRLGNVVSLEDLLQQFDPSAVRLFLTATAHYRSRLDVTEEGLHGAGEQVRRLRELRGRLVDLEPSAVADAALAERAEAARRGYREALDDDLNLAQGLGQVMALIREANTALDAGAVGEGAREALLHVLADVDRHLDVLTGEETELEAEIQEQVDRREEARRNRDYATADRIRQELADRGILLEDTAQGVRWRRQGVQL
jgi:cysteinyl-tRNA synthetase